jgi:hypothetical protein
MKSTSKITEASKGQITIQYSGDGPGDLNFPVDSVTVTAELMLIKNKWTLSFPLDYPRFPVTGGLHCNLEDFTTQRPDFCLYRVEAIQISENEFLLLVNYAWTKPIDLENFHAVARFKGVAPACLCPKKGPF